MQDFLRNHSGFIAKFIYKINKDRRLAPSAFVQIATISIYYRVPVEPKPPSPRTVSVNSSASS